MASLSPVLDGKNTQFQSIDRDPFMQRKILTALTCAVSLAAVTAANATPPGFGGGSPHGAGSPHDASPHAAGSPHGGGMGMGHAATRGEGDPKARSVQHWWPQQVDLSELRKNRTIPNPHGEVHSFSTR